MKTKESYGASIMAYERLYTVLDRHIHAGMYQEIDNYFVNGYYDTEDGEKVLKTDTPFEYNLLTGTLQGEIEEFARFLDTQFTHIPSITEVPMYRRVVIEQPKVLREFADEMVEILRKYDGTEETYEVSTGRKRVKTDTPW